jgi:hypothetical protein
MLEKWDVTEDLIYKRPVTEVVTMIKHGEMAGEWKKWSIMTEVHYN